jgi:folate-binding protein YgfZ
MSEVTDSSGSRTADAAVEELTEPDLRAYRALRESAALLVREERTVLQVRGKEAREHFGGLLTNHVEALEEGDGAYSFMLTPKGRPVAEMRVLAASTAGSDGEDDEGEVLWVDLPGACVDSARDHLGRFLPPRLASYEVVEGLRRIGVVGPAADSVVEAAGLPLPPARELGHRALPGDGPAGIRRVARREGIEGPGVDLYLPEDGLPAAREILGGPLEEAGGAGSGDRAWGIYRLERGLPVYGREIDADVLPQETGQQDRAVDFEKGCYTGQEVVARIHYRGKVNRHLRGLRFHGDGGEEGASELPPEGTGLHGDGRDRGSVTSTARSPRLGSIGLGYVRREVEPGETLNVGGEDGPPCSVVELPFPGA